MNDHPTSLDLNRLEFVRPIGTKFVAQCPACAADGHDNKGEHLAIYPNGAYGCVVHPGDKDHNRKIFALAGIRGARTSYRPQKPHGPQELNEGRKNASIEAARSKRGTIVTRYPWSIAEMLNDSPQKLYNSASLLQTDPRHFLASLFAPDALLWTGETHHSGCSGRYAHHWRTCREWCACPVGGRCGPMVSPAIWKPGTVSRAQSEIASASYLVLDFDGFDGVPPPKLGPHLAASLATIRWLRDVEGWQLAAILWTGNKSLHAWFHTPPRDAVEHLHPMALALGMDPTLIGHPEHPCRLPGHSHAKTGFISRVLWLQATPYRP